MSQGDDPINELLTSERRDAVDRYVINLLTAANTELQKDREELRSALGGASTFVGILAGMLLVSWVWIGFLIWGKR